MCFLRYEVTPASDHPQIETVGMGLICCWVERESREEADRVARRDIANEKWNVLACDCALGSARTDFSNDAAVAD